MGPDSPPDTESYPGLQKYFCSRGSGCSVLRLTQRGFHKEKEMNFRKGIFALAVAGLGLTSIASAQVTCTSGTAVPAFLRAEGTTELAPEVSVGGCTYGAQV